MELERLQMINMISGFRPAETIFEVGQRGTRKISPATSMMRERRQNVGKTIGAFKSRTAEAEAAEDLAIQKAKEEARNNKSQQQQDSFTDLGDDVAEDELASTFNIPSTSKKDGKTGNCNILQRFILTFCFDLSRQTQDLPWRRILHFLYTKGC